MVDCGLGIGDESSPLLLAQLQPAEFLFIEQADDLTDPDAQAVELIGCNGA
jgi:hypothetical protein